MRRFIPHGLPALLVLLAVAVILILSGSGDVGLVLGLAVAGAAGILIASTLLYDVARGEPGNRPRARRVYPGTRAKGF